jgi:hypothetical protein
MFREDRTLDTLVQFDRPISGGRIKFTEAFLPPQPAGIEELVAISWDRQLRVKKADMFRENQLWAKGTHYDPVSDNRLDALYDNDGQRRMYSGPVVTLMRVVIDVSEPEVDKQYQHHGIIKPRPSLAICTYAQTLDNCFTATVRGPGTTMYPGRKYGQGGNPQSPEITIIEHQIKENADEILVTPEDYNPEDFKFSGVVVDLEDLPNKPDLAGFVPVQLNSEEIKRRVSNRVKHPNDSVDVAFIPADPEGLQKYMITTDPKEFTPGGFGTLLENGRVIYGSDWYGDVIKELKIT